MVFLNNKLKIKVKATLRTFPQIDKSSFNPFDLGLTSSPVAVFFDPVLSVNQKSYPIPFSQSKGLEDTSGLMD
ncbi:hypothetical protein HanXRQr2_Chr08g0333031 [Helianthus annuus]|uniref:Uncharacterized protein n=1 Tax=Helianthus annuus TaxID=4232 RepID=A0A251U7D9_HELAN|nr:hypothetical protein HanXRQr2_Chr08g0333031 [Helianthus annuus]